MSCRREETAAAQRQAAKTAREKAAAAKKQSAEDKKNALEKALQWEKAWERRLWRVIPYLLKLRIRRSTILGGSGDLVSR